MKKSILLASLCSACALGYIGFAFAPVIAPTAYGETIPYQEQQQEQQERESLPDRAYEKAEWVFDHATEVRYEHLSRPASEQVRDQGRVSKNDCSGFVSYIIHSVAPKHYMPIRDRQPRHAYPQAKSFAKFFGSLSTSEPHDGWLRVPTYKYLRRGDIIAWTKKVAAREDHGGHGNTGHVMIVRGTPGDSFQETIDGLTFRMVDIPVIDSSSVYHFKPEILPPNAAQNHRNGLGKGAVRLVLDQEDRAIGYWEGYYWGEGHKDVDHPAKCDEIFFGRMVPLESR